MKSWYCDSCQQEVKEDRIYCKYCGKKEGEKK